MRLSKNLLQHLGFATPVSQTRLEQHLVALRSTFALGPAFSLNPVNQTTQLDDYQRVGSTWYVKSLTLEGYDGSTLGKSCDYDEYNKTWKCRECSPDKNNSTARCHPLKRRGYCNPFRRESWKLRAFSEYDPKSSLDMEMRTLRNVQNGNRYHEKQPLCMPLSLFFNLSQCNSSILTIYTNEITMPEKS